MTKVYVVEFGAYSDRYVAAVFSDHDAAAAYARTDDGSVTEHDLDPDLDEKARRQLRPGEHRYQVAMGRDGSGASAWESFEPLEYALRHLTVRLNNGNPTRFAGDCWASDEEHAIKILNDRRTQWLALGSHVGKETRPGHGWYEATVSQDAAQATGGLE